MDIEVYVQDSNTGESFNISTLCSVITLNSYIDGQPGKLTCLIQRDPNNILKLSNGSIIGVHINKYPMFYGYVTDMGRDSTETYQITAYDQLFYLQNKDILETKNQTASQIFEAICKRATPNLRYKIKYPSSYVCPKHMHINVKSYSIIEYGLQHTQINEEKKYFIYDDFGTLTFTNVFEELTNMVIGDASLLMDYKYEISISKGTANRAIVYKIDKETGENLRYEAIDSSNMKRWGTLVHFEEAGKEMNYAQMRELAHNVLKWKNKETKTMRLNAIGDPSFKVGMGFILQIEALGIRENMWIESIKHTITKDTHFVEMEVFA